ncbi:MAG: hypothetical protein WCT31_01560 [Candidatus Micrarchaeia archaeon]|jgi:hypothetical protein
MDVAAVQRKIMPLSFEKPNLFFGANGAILPMGRELNVARIQPKFSMEPEIKHGMECRSSGLSRDYTPTFSSPAVERVPLHLFCKLGEWNIRPAAVKLANPDFVVGGMLPSAAAPEVKKLKKAGLIK